MPLPPATVAVLDDEPKMRTALRRLLSTHGFHVEDYQTGRAFFDALPTHPTDCLVLDLHMPEISGYEVLATFASRQISTPVVVVSAHREPGTEERVRALGASAFFDKPVDGATLVAGIDKAIFPEKPTKTPRL